MAAARVNHRRINTEMGRVHAIPRPASPAFIVRVSTHPRGPLRTRHLDIYIYIYIRRQYRPDGPKIIPPPRRIASTRPLRWDSCTKRVEDGRGTRPPRILFRISPEIVAVNRRTFNFPVPRSENAISLHRLRMFDEV